MQLDLAGVAVSLGSACASGASEPSPTLRAMRVPEDRIRSSVRFSLGANTTEAEVDEALARGRRRRRADRAGRDQNTKELNRQDAKFAKRTRREERSRERDIEENNFSCYYHFILISH